MIFLQIKSSKSWSKSADTPVSPSDRFDDVFTKFQEYLSAGTRLVWVFQPRAKTVMVYRGNGEVVLQREQDELSGEDVLPGFRCRLAELFA